MLKRISRLISSYGPSLFILSAIALILLVVIIISWFSPGIYATIERLKLFQALVIVSLLEIIYFLIQRSLTQEPFGYFDEAEYQDKIRTIIRQESPGRLDIISAGLISRYSLIVDALKSGLKVRVLVPAFDVAIDRRVPGYISKALQLIWNSIDNDQKQKFEVWSYDYPPTLRAVIIADKKLRPVIGFVGWYRYEKDKSTNNIFIRGSENPTFFVSQHTPIGRAMLAFFVSACEQYFSEAQKVDVRQLIQ